MPSIDWKDASAPTSTATSKNTPVAGLAPSNPWFAVSMLLIGLIGGFVLARSGAGGVLPSTVRTTPPPTVVQAPPPAQLPPPQPQTAGDLPPIDPKVDHIRGEFSKAKVAVVEYSDFECPFCQRHHPTMQQIVDTYKDDVVWVYRHFPLSFHQNAQKEAEATECANELGGNDVFWKYTDAIFERTTAGGTGFPLENLAPLAKELGLDELKFKSCLDSGKYAKHVQDDMSGGSAAGVNGTPGNIVVNLKTKETRIVSGAQPFAAFKSVFDAMLGTPAANAAPADKRTISMSAELWKFTPNIVRVKQGEKVILEVTGISGTHGLSVPELGINETITQGNTVIVNIPTDKTGTFDFACSVQCGSGHSDMTGKIIVEA